MFACVFTSMMFIQIKNTFWGYFTELHTNDLCTFCLCISLQFKNKTAASSCLRPFTSESLGVKPWQGHFQECTQGWRHCPSPLLLCSVQEGRPMAVCLGAYHVCLSCGQDAAVWWKEGWRILCADDWQQEWPSGGEDEAAHLQWLETHQEHQPSGTACSHPPLRSDSWI